MDVPEDYIDWRGDPASSQPPPGPAANAAPATVPITVPTSSPSPRGPRRVGLIVASTVVATLAIAGLAVAVVLHLRAAPPGAGAHVVAPSASAATPTAATPRATTARPSASTASPTQPKAPPPAARPASSSPRPPSADQVALTRLDLVRAADAAAVRSDLDGRWVPLLAAKTAGIRDPQQLTRSGSHVFGWADILDEHDRLHSDPRLAGNVLLMRSTDYGRRHRYHGKPLYVTFADLDFSSAADVRAWCDVTFPELGTALRRDSCSPGRLTPPR